MDKKINARVFLLMMAAGRLPEASINIIIRKDVLHCFSEIFSWEHTSKIPVVEAVRISMSIPLFFAAIRNEQKDVYVDGGVF